MFPSLLQAVRLLRVATARQDADPVLDAECAGALLHLWHVHGTPALLAEALGHARRSARRAPTGPGHATAAAVLGVQAGEAVCDADPATALRLLARADTAYAAACRAAADTPTLCRLTLNRVRALEMRWSLDGDDTALHMGIGMLEAVTDFAGATYDVALVHGRLLRRLAATSDDPVEARDHVARSVHCLTTAVAGLRPGQVPELDLELADALLDAGPDHHEELHAFLTRRLADASAVRQAHLLVRAAHLSLALHRETRDRQHLATAEEHITRSLADLPDDGPEYPAALELLASVLLCAEPPAAQGTGRAVSALRACIRATPHDDPALAERLALLGRALLARYHLTGDRIDLREAEHCLRLAADTADEPFTRASRLLECGQVRITAAAGLNRPARLDDAVAAFRAVVRATQEATGVFDVAARPPRRTVQAVVLTARALHLTGTAHEAAQRPVAAHAAYRRAVQEWTGLPAGMEVTAAPAPRDSAQRLAALDGTPGLTTTTGDP
ncbi:hypothetical protein [Actinacidiphila glaucinigra]|uniref:hypothetical protein n=1 Tax=Actinacidiphila glaucinigra TaxID=235986 RepID=UPI00371D7A55